MSALGRGGRALHRVVLPADRAATAVGAAAVLPLYVEGAPRPDLVTGRHGYRVPAGESVSFATYFNAFPAGYWQRWTDVEEVVLEVDVSASAAVRVLRSDAEGAATVVGAHDVEPHDGLRLRLALDGFDRGGWLWFEVTATAEDVEIRSADWMPAHDERPGVTASVGVTTYNRVESCLALLRQLGDDATLLELVDRVVVVDQGEHTISAAPGFTDATAALGDRLRVIEQPNLGGSGGFARCQLEALHAGQSDHLVILDDDVVLETEAVRRAVEFAAHTTGPTLVGAHMFSLPEPTRLHAMGESVDLRRFSWGPNRGSEREYDLAAGGLRGTPFLHRVEDVNYNGWWMCLIPRRVLEDIGLSLPFFIRWDDAEYGLRAGAAGYPTVSLPGVAVWHVPWTHKTAGVDWQSYFHHRNQIVAALLHSPHEHGGRLAPELLLHQVKHLASMQYGTAELRLLAMADVLDGPRHLHESLSSKRAEVHRLRSGFTDGDVRASIDEFPPAGGEYDGQGHTPPRWVRAATGVLRQLKPTTAQSRRTPQVHLRAVDAHWTRLLTYDSAVVSAADGSGAVWYRRDRRMFADIARRSLSMHRRLHRQWPSLAAEYREALAEIASPAAWQETFESVRRGPA